MLSDLFRYGNSNLHQRLDPRNALFENYQPTQIPRTIDRKARRSPSPANPYQPGIGQVAQSMDSYGYRKNPTDDIHTFRAALPNKRGQYSDATLSSLESQNDSEVEGIMGKVRLLKNMTVAIGDEIRESSALAEKMNDSFEGTRVRLRGTMSRMLVMAQKTGVGWKAWFAFLMAVVLLFWWVRFLR
ncbi:hypothetical protein K3495_g1965 [Podosphaera aphanis]|nr:hypothetical protein K3495_g1965 [Podosphaera aphanis]